MAGDDKMTEKRELVYHAKAFHIGEDDRLWVLPADAPPAGASQQPTANSPVQDANPSRNEYSKESNEFWIPIVKYLGAAMFFIFFYIFVLPHILVKAVDFFNGTETIYTTMAGPVTCKTQFFTQTCTWMDSEFTAIIEGDKLKVREVRSGNVPPEFTILLVSPPKRLEK